MTVIYKEHQESDLGRCIPCIPLRRGVLYVVYIELLWNLLAVTGLVSDDFRAVSGGYQYYSRIGVTILAVIGTLVTYVYGVMGVYDACWERLDVFHTFLYVKMVLIFGFVAMDFQVLIMCESIPEDYPTVREIAKRGQCSGHTMGTIIFFLVRELSLIICAYFVKILSDKWREGIRYKINFNRDSFFVTDKSFEDRESYMALDRGRPPAQTPMPHGGGQVPAV
ncbi:unnamed protein product [Amoebophrya sp. A25]|nr:unnamed protein product [Amoebophrya sp. A25]|eukprot:GSA25T00025527001.1